MEYQILQVIQLINLNQGEAGTLLDTFWPHIFGELGVLGALLLHINYNK